MASQPNDDRVWHLGSTKPRLSPSDPWTVNIGEPISNEDYASHRESASFLDEVLTNSAFARFQEVYTEFKAAYLAGAQAFAAGQSTTPSFPIIRRKFDDLLTALRRFDDRTSHALSSRYGGKESVEYATFKKALSSEFDERFAYGFCFNLRNYSDHRGSPIARISQSSSLNPDGEVDHVFEALFDAKKLLENHKWPPRVREDLKQIDGEFPVESTVDELYQACGRAHCKNLLSQEGKIVDACEIIRPFATRANAGKDLAPIFVQANPEDLIARRPGPFSVSPIRTEMIAVAQAALQEAHQFA